MIKKIKKIIEQAAESAAGLEGSKNGNIECMLFLLFFNVQINYSAN